MTTLADRVIARRKELNMTQEELARRMGLKSRSSISKIESGREAKQKTIASLAQALDVTIPYLMGWDEHPEDQAAFEAAILQDEDVMEMVHLYMAKGPEEREALKQMARLMPNAKRRPPYVNHILK